MKKRKVVMNHFMVAVKRDIYAAKKRRIQIHVYLNMIVVRNHQILRDVPLYGNVVMPLNQILDVKSDINVALCQVMDCIYI